MDPSENKSNETNRETQISPREEIVIQRPKRGRLTPEESLQRMKDFDKRKDEFIASIRKSKN